MTVAHEIRRILVANRGEIASRVFRTARLLGVATVAVHSDADTDAPFVREADRAVRLPGVASTDTYLNTERIIDAAKIAGADAIHPGYGFLSENPAFARAVRDAGITWIGPTPESIEAMALKVEAKRTAAAAGVPLVPGAELAAGRSDDEVRATCAAVGYPLLIKASAGGGGRGMRVVSDAADLLDSIASARREATSAFGDDTVFVERYLADARHVEVQVFGDTHGNVVHLFERECSVQRRHQKVIEESPSPGVTARVRTALHDSALSLSRAIGYVGAGTVEFMVVGSGDEQEHFFLEMNTRLQVEHPVTELVTGTDLVAWQIAVASGQQLPLTQDQIGMRGHAIEARLYAEDPAHDYLPATGLVHRFSWEARPGLRVDAGVADGSVISSHYDPMLAKVVAHAPSRDIAGRILAGSLRRLTLHGPVTNRASLVAILDDPDFRAGDATTAFLDDHPDVLRGSGAASDDRRHALAVAAALEAAGRDPSVDIPTGWRNVPGTASVVSLRDRAAGDVVTVLVDHGRRGRGFGILRTPGPPYKGAYALNSDVIDATVDLTATGEGVVAIVEMDGVRSRCQVARYGDDVFVDDGLVSTAWTIVPRFVDHSLDAAGHGPQTAVPGTITAVEVAVGDRVVAGQPLVVLEAMKMEHRILSDVDAVVSAVLVEVGQSVDAHTVVVTFADADAGDGDD